IAASLATRAWYEHALISWLLLAAATGVWASELRSGERRYWFFYVAGMFSYEMLRAQADSFFSFPVHVDYPIRFDELLFGGHEPVVWLQSRLFSPSHISVVDVLATLMHWS